MPVTAAIAHLVLVLEDENLLSAQVLDHLGDDAGAVHEGSTDVCLAVSAEQQHTEVNCVADVSGQPVNVEYLARFDPVLPATGADYCVNGIASVG